MLRQTSLDELPQLIDVLRGDLSLVGPRPIIVNELEQYGDRKEKFLSVTPGLTGYWQAYTRSDCDYPRRMEMELYYIDSAGLMLDIKILFATVISVIKKAGAV
jgi:lipopolysaccharide/colanic/teichoic acid biosynthesis glycosyltransferase